MSNTCGWSCADPAAQCVLDGICAGFQSYLLGNDRWLGGSTTIADMIDSFETHFDATGGRIEITEGLANLNYTALYDADFGLEAVKNFLNDINDLVVDTLTAAGNASDNTDQLKLMLGYPTDGSFTVRQDFINTRTAFSIVDTLNTLVGARLGLSVGTWGNALTTIAAYFLDKTGVLKAVPQNDAMAGAGMVPPLASLEADSHVAITEGTTYTAPNGSYGLALHLDVPAYWGREDNTPNLYVPPVARINWLCGLGSIGNPRSTSVAFPVLYPLPQGADRVNITLAVNVTGTYAWLRLPH